MFCSPKQVLVVGCMLFFGVPALVGLVANIVTGVVVLCEAWDRYDQIQINRAGIARREKANRTLYQAVLDHGYPITDEHLPVSTKEKLLSENNSVGTFFFE